MRKKIQNKKIQDLIKKVEPLKEVEKGKLKGGFKSISTKEDELNSGSNGIGCTCN